MSNGLKVSVKLEKQRITAGCDARLYGTVLLEAPRYIPERRPPLDLVACIDVSGSMEGRKIDEARLAVRQLIANLDDQDRLGVVTFNYAPKLAAALTSTTPEGRKALSDQVEALEANGGTNMSGGAELALELLTGEPRVVDGKQAMRRVIFFTDGHANSGVREGDRAGWSALFEKHLGDSSVSWFGFGEDHDAHFLSDLADVTRGNAYVAKDADAIGTAFAQELGSLVGIVAKDIRIRLTGLGGAAGVLNDEKVERDGDTVVVSLADLTSQERKHVVFELPVNAGALGEEAKVVEVDVSWVDVRTQSTDAVAHSGRVSFVSSAAADASSPEVLEPVAVQKGAQAQKEAAKCTEAGDVQRSWDILSAAADYAKAIGTEEGMRIARRLYRLTEEYYDVVHYQRNRSNLKSVQRSTSKGRASGSRYDAEFMTGVQFEMATTFRKEVAPSESDDVDSSPRISRRFPTPPEKP